MKLCPQCGSTELSAYWYAWEKFKDAPATAPARCDDKRCGWQGKVGELQSDEHDPDAPAHQRGYLH